MRWVLHEIASLLAVAVFVGGLSVVAVGLSDHADGRQPVARVAGIDR